MAQRWDSRQNESTTSFQVSVSKTGYYINHQKIKIINQYTKYFFIVYGGLGRQGWNSVYKIDNFYANQSISQCVSYHYLSALTHNVCDIIISVHSARQRL